MKPFYVIRFNPNSNKFEKYDIMERLIDDYNYEEKKPTDFAKFVKNRALYRWWAKCEYEVILSDWPCQKTEEKWDIYTQVMMNFDLIVEVFTENVKELSNKKK